MKHGIVICVTHFYIISPKSIDTYIELDLIYLIRALRKEKKYKYFAMMKQIKDTLSSLSIVAKNISFGPLIPFFSSLAILFPTYYYTTIANCDFISCSKRTI